MFIVVNQNHSTQGRKTNLFLNNEHWQHMEKQFELVRDQIEALTTGLFGFLKSCKDKMKRYKENSLENALDTKLQFSKAK
jgi:hypothetical protein